ncbi:phosphomannomutase [Acinetobacter sp. ANC 5054]|uniref:phosphomannomutase/phosphoglucomutase n=1 Tax=Acinetobacter sp. ANC 5054 TaxID=1977877 RepID=UPI000A34D367|nr:phosphomannomutase/phosphoglucomutase [Acinetobacter sp. ANC 5054]OTG80497.1 phosphomannomutase [Acinetobacter sp. ANC 5054]
MGSLFNTFPIHIFRAYDIRGKISHLNADLVHSIACGLVKQYLEAGQNKLVIGYDARLTSPTYAKIIQQVCCESGIHTEIIGCCSSPMLYFIARQFDGNGIMVTASHNPKSDNGIKWIVQGEPPCPEMIQHVAVNAQKSYLVERTHLMTALEPHELKPEYCLQYQKFILDDIQIQHPLKVAIDGMHGSAGHCAALLLKKLGCEVIALRCQADGHFPDHAPDPSQLQHLQKLQQAVKGQAVDIGIALDGDGDRLVLLDEKGDVVSADRLLCLFAEICLEQQPKSEVVFDVKCSTMIRDTVQQLHGQPVMIRTGSSFLRKYISQSAGKAVFGGEYAGHYVFNDGRGGGYDDGLYAALRVIEYLQAKGLSLSQVMSRYPERCGTEDLYVNTHHHNPKDVLKWVDVKSKAIPAQISKIDGIRLDFDDGFGIIRASNTGEYFTLRFDANQPKRLKEIRDLFVSMLIEQYPDIAQDIPDVQ